MDFEASCRDDAADAAAGERLFVDYAGDACR